MSKEVHENSESKDVKESKQESETYTSDEKERVQSASDRIRSSWYDSQDANTKEELDDQKKKDYNESDVQKTKETDKIANIKCQNESLEGKNHPVTDIPFERRRIEVEGKEYEVVVPKFESKFDAQLPEDKYTASDRVQFKECNNQLREEIDKNPKLKSQFDARQLEMIKNGDTPSGYVWHHDASAGKMQLVDSDIHGKTGHTGGRNIWGGGTDNR